MYQAANTLNSGMKAMGITPQQAMSAMNKAAPLVPNRPGGAKPPPQAPRETLFKQ